MPPMNPFPVFRSLPVRSRPTAAFRAGIKRPAVYRSYADDAANKHNVLPEAQDGNKVGPNMNQQEHVSEEASKMQQIMGQEGPDIEGQGTPVQEVRCGTKNEKVDIFADARHRSWKRTRPRARTLLRS